MESKRILIVEDDEAIRTMMQDVLELHGYDITTAADGREGIRQLQIATKLPAVILLDLMMPGTNGWEFLDFQRGDPRLASVPVVVCSAYKESAKAVRPSAVLEKPLQLNKLLSAVDSFCA